MPEVVHLHVLSSFISIAPSSHRHLVTIPAGANIDAFGDLVEPGLHRIRFNGRDLLAFTRDILERTEQVEADHGVREQ